MKAKSSSAKYLVSTIISIIFCFPHIQQKDFACVHSKYVYNITYLRYYTMRTIFFSCEMVFFACKRIPARWCFFVQLPGQCWWPIRGSFLLTHHCTQNQIYASTAWKKKNDWWFGRTNRTERMKGEIRAVHGTHFGMVKWLAGARNNYFDRRKSLSIMNSIDAHSAVHLLPQRWTWLVYDRINCPSLQRKLYCISRQTSWNRTEHMDCYELWQSISNFCLFSFICR